MSARSRAWAQPGIPQNAPAGGGGPGMFREQAWPGPTGIRACRVGDRVVVVNCDEVERLQVAFELALPKLPGEAGKELAALVTPEALGMIAAIAVVWGASHFIGVGEVIDVVIVGVGVIALGADALEVGKHFYQFVGKARSARSETELGEAADHFARAVAIVGVGALITFLTKSRVKGRNRRPRVKTGGILAGISELASRLRSKVDDVGEVLAELQRRARDPEQAEQVMKMLELLERQLGNFQGRPKLRLTTSEERWVRASDIFDDVADASRKGPLKDPGTGKTIRSANDQGLYLAPTADREAGAILSKWNKMDIVEQQVLPSYSVVLEGTAAPQSAAKFASGASASARNEVRLGGGHQAFHAGQLPPKAPVSGPAIRPIEDGHVVAPGGKRLPNM